MSKNTLETIKKLEKLAAWHRIKAERAGLGMGGEVANR